MSKFTGLVLIILSLILVNSCTLYKKATVSSRENLRNQPDIRIYAIYTINGDTIPIDHDSKIITRISDYNIKFIDRNGNIQTVPMSQISGFLIREENRPATIALKITGIVLLVGATAVLFTYLFVTMLIALSA